MELDRMILGKVVTRRSLWLLVVTAPLFFWLFTSGTAGAADALHGKIQYLPPAQTIPDPTPEPTFAPQPTPRPDRDDDDDQAQPTPTSAQQPPAPAQQPPAPSASAAQGQLTATVAVPILNVRGGPGTNFPVIGRVAGDAVVTILGRNAAGTWLNVCCLPNSTTTGWISAQFVTPNGVAGQAALSPVLDTTSPSVTTTVTSPPLPAESGVRTGVVSAVALNMRAAPATTAAILGKVRSGNVVTVLARNDAGTWWLICCVPNGEGNAWVSAEFVTPNFVDAANLPISTDRTVPVVPAAAPIAAASGLTPTQVPLEEATLQVAVQQDRPAARQGEQIVLAFTVTNTGTAQANRVELSFELPAGLSFVSASANSGNVFQEDASSGAVIALVTWANVPAGASVDAEVTALIAEDIADGTVIDGAAAAVAENAELAAAPVSVGLPPLLPPDFQ